MNIRFIYDNVLCLSYVLLLLLIFILLCSTNWVYKYKPLGSSFLFNIMSNGVSKLAIGYLVYLLGFFFTVPVRKSDKLFPYCYYKVPNPPTGWGVCPTFTGCFYIRISPNKNCSTGWVVEPSFSSRITWKRSRFTKINSRVF